MTKKILLITIIVLISGCEKEIRGFVFDCETDKPVNNAVVSTNQLGWGVINNQIVWDKSYRTFTNTNESGYFELAYEIGNSAKIHVVKDGYYSAEQFEDTADNIKIGMLAGNNPLEFTHNCRPLSECISCTEENEVTVCRDICFD